MMAPPVDPACRTDHYEGQLFTQFFLTDGIRTTPEWESAAPKLADFRRDVGSVRQRFGALQQPNEAVTEQVRSAIREAQQRVRAINT